MDRSGLHSQAFPNSGSSGIRLGTQKSRPDDRLEGNSENQLQTGGDPPSFPVRSYHKHGLEIEGAGA